MAQDSEKTRVQKLLSKITDRPIVAYILVAATILGGIASFTAAMEKIFDASTKVSDLLSKVDPDRPPSLWIRLDGHVVKDETGLVVNEAPKGGHFVQLSFPPLTEAIADPLPLNISAMYGGTPKPRKFPIPKPYDMYYATYIPKGIYRLLDVDTVKMPSGRDTAKKGSEPTRVVYLDSKYNEIHASDTKFHTEVWGRIENLKSFGIQ
jgi:hypothetical protein